MSRKATDRLPAATAFGVSLGALVLAGLVALIVLVSSLRSGNGDLRVLANAAEDKSRDQARKLVVQLGETGRRADPATTPATAQSTGQPPATSAPSLWASLWQRWIAREAPAASPSDPKSSDATSGSQILERLRPRQAKPQPPPAAPDTTADAAPVPGTLASAKAASTETNAAKSDTTPTRFAWLEAVLRRLGWVNAPDDAARPAVPPTTEIVSIAPELTPPLSRAVFAPLDQHSPATQSAPVLIEELPPGPRDTVAIARFLMSEHDLGITEPPGIAAPPILRPPPDTPPLIVSDPPAAQASTARQPAASSKRRHASAAECNAINEQAQLRDLTDRDRIFLQEYCR